MLCWSHLHAQKVPFCNNLDVSLPTFKRGEKTEQFQGPSYPPLANDEQRCFQVLS